MIDPDYRIQGVSARPSSPAMPPTSPSPAPPDPRPLYSWTGGLLPVLTRTEPGGRVVSAVGVIFDISFASQVVLALNLAGDDAAERDQLRADLRHAKDVAAELRRQVLSLEHQLVRAREVGYGGR